MKVLLFDTETTGLDPRKSYVISIGAIMYDTETEKVDEFYRVLNWYEIQEHLNINFEIPDFITKINGFNKEKLISEGINPVKAFADFYDFIVENVDSQNIKKHLNVCSAWNLPFDVNMVKSNLLFLQEYNRDFKTNPVDGYKILELIDDFNKSYRINSDNSILFIDNKLIDNIYHSEIDPKTKKKISHSLQKVGERYNIEEDPNAHNALADTRRLFDIWKIHKKELDDKNINIDSEFEDLLIVEYRKQQAIYKKKEKKNGYYSDSSLDYFSYNMTKLEV